MRWRSPCTWVVLAATAEEVVGRGSVATDVTEEKEPCRLRRGWYALWVWFSEEGLPIIAGDGSSGGDEIGEWPLEAGKTCAVPVETAGGAVATGVVGT